MRTGNVVRICLTAHYFMENLMSLSRKKETLKHHMETHREEIQKLSYDTRMLIAALLDLRRVTDAETGEEEVIELCEAWDGAMQMYKEEGRIEGRVEGRTEGEASGRGKVNQLIEWLFRDGRQNEVLRCATDMEFQNELLVEYGL